MQSSREVYYSLFVHNKKKEDEKKRNLEMSKREINGGKELLSFLFFFSFSIGVSLYKGGEPFIGLPNPFISQPYK